MFQSLFQSIPSITLDGSSTSTKSAESKTYAASKTFQTAGDSLANLFLSLSTSTSDAKKQRNSSRLTRAPSVNDRRTKTLARERSPSLLDNAALFLQSLSLNGNAANKAQSSPSRRLANGVKRRQSMNTEHGQSQQMNMIQMDTFLNHNHDACTCLKSGTQTFVLKTLNIPESSLPDKLVDVPFHIFAHPPHRCLVRHDKIAAELGVRNGKLGRKDSGVPRNGHRLSTRDSLEQECCDPVTDCLAAYSVFANGVNDARLQDEAFGHRALIQKTSSGERWILKDSRDVHLKTWIDRYDSEACHNAAVKSDVILLASREEELPGSALDVTTVHALMTCLESLVDSSSGMSDSKLNDEWIALQKYEEQVGLSDDIRIARLEENEHKNFDDKFVPYDHSRVVLGNRSGVKYTSDYINASYITDYDPAKPRYIAAQTPLCSTLIDFWQMVWENECTSIVNLCPLRELVASACQPCDAVAQSDANNNDHERRALVRYWPKNGAELYDNIEVHLVAEHVVRERHLVIRSFFVQHTGTKRSRTITQFNYLTWHEDSTPESISALLDLRRRLHRSDHSGAPILVHCSNGSGRTGAFILIDLFLASVSSESMREFNLIGAIEHLRDQRFGMVGTRAQFDTAICAIVASIQECLKTRS